MSNSEIMDVFFGFWMVLDLVKMAPLVGTCISSNQPDVKDFEVGTPS